MPKLFGVEVDDQMLEGLNDEDLLKEVNDIRKKLGHNKFSENKLQKYFLKVKDQSKLTEDEKKLLEANTEQMTDFDIADLRGDIECVIKFRSEKRKETEKKKFEENNPEKKSVEQKDVQKTEENLNKEAEDDKKEAEKIEEEVTTEENKTEEKKEESKEEVKAEKTEKNESTSNEKTDVKEDTGISREKLDQETEAFAKNVEKVQKAQKNMAGAAVGDDREMLQQGPEAYLKVLNDLLIEKAQKANRGLLPGDEILQYMQDVQRGKALNAQNNGVLEEQMLEKRADTIQNIGEEYQQNKKLTPKLVEQMSAVDAIDNVLVSITRNPKLLFITVLLMGLNPFMALGLAVLSAFGNAVVQDLYQKLPETDRSNLENRPAQEQQPAYNPQFEACQKALAEATQQLKDKEMMLQKYQQRDREIMQRRALMAYLNSLKKADLERIKANEEKMKQEAKAEKDVKKPEAKKEVKAEKKQSVKEDVHKEKTKLEPPVLKKPEVKKEMTL